jgi:UDP-N-acetylglucosamine 2-epimerase (non-hydrolysing)
MKFCIVVGTRPEIIKMSPIIRLCQKNQLNYFILHSGQHYSYDMDKVFFENLELPDANYNLDVGSGSHGVQTAEILHKTEEILLKEKPDIILVEGDTNTVFASALAASKLGMKVGHVEAGLRSYDRTMPEEINRVLTDHISDLLFCPTEKAKKTAFKEGIKENKIYVTGNTIVDAVEQNKEIAFKKSIILEKLSLKKQNYFLVTAHRQENVDKKEKLINIIKALDKINKKYSLPVIYPIHPRTKNKLKLFNIKIPENISFVSPLNFLDFLQLEANAKLILTDSGGVQEESCILKNPCVTLRENTERPETLTVGSNMLAGTNPDKILNTVKIMLDRKRDWKNPFGSGNAAEQIMQIINHKNG